MPAQSCHRKSLRLEEPWYLKYQLERSGVVIVEPSAKFREHCSACTLCLHNVKQLQFYVHKELHVRDRN